MSKTYACFASSSQDDPDIAVWFTPEKHKLFLERAYADVQKLCDDTGHFRPFSISYVLQPDVCTNRNGLEDQLEALAEDDCAGLAANYEWFEDPPPPPDDDKQHVRIDFSKFVCDDKHFWFVVREKYSEVEYQTDYFAWADLPEGIL